MGGNMRFRSLATAILLSTSSIYAQTATGTIQGVVMDPSQAHVVGARVTVTERSTNFSRAQASDSTGAYAFRALPIGNYTIQVQAPGFAKEVISSVVLEVAQTMSVDITLKPASASQTVVVGEAPPLLQITDSSLSSVINHSRVETLPLNGRNVLQLVSYAAGVTLSGKGTATERQANYGMGFTVGGQRDDTNVVLVDGVEISGMELNNYALAIPSLDDIQEFNVQTSNYPAEFGGNSGAFINIATKRGSNQLHGSLFEYLRNTGFDARNYFATKPSPLHRNQFGAAIGGPVVLPRLYNGTGKTFWFFSYEGLRQNTSVISTALVPTNLERTGDFSQTGTTIVDPYTKVPFPNDMIPSYDISKVGQALLDLYPPSNATGTTNYIGGSPQTSNTDMISGRIDHKVSERDNAFARFTINQIYAVSPGVNAAFTGYSQNQRDWNLQVVAGNTAVITPHIVNESNIGYVKFDRNRGSQAANVQNWVQQLGITGFAPPPYAWAAPELVPLGLTAIGYGPGNAVFNWSSSSLQLIDNLSIQKGAHTFKMGATVNFKTLASTQFGSADGAYTFSGEFSAQNPAITTTSANAVADLLLGYPSAYSLQTSPYVENFRYTLLGTYFQDDWRVTPRLSLNLGLRWEYFGKPADKNNHIATFNLANGTQVVAGTSSLPRNLLYQEYTDFSPRVGFGLRLFGNGRTSLRGAYGLFYSPELINTFRNLGFQNPFGTTYSLSIRPANPNAPIPVFTVNAPLANASPLVNFNSVLGINPHFKDAYSGSWNLTLQQLFGSNTLLEIAYRGSHTLHLSSELNYNLTRPYPPQPPQFTLNYPYPSFGTVNYFDSNGLGNYNALQIRFQKQMSHGFQFLGNYTWDKNMTNIDQSSVGSSASPGNEYAPQTLDLHDNYGFAAAGRPQEFVLSSIYQIPFFAKRSTILSEAAGGWSAGIDWTFASGAWLTPSSYGTTYTGPRASLIGNPNLPRGQRTISRWYNTSDVVNPAPGQLGNSGKGTIMGSGTILPNLVLMKDFKLGEGNLVQFRSEFFNAFNHPQFDDPHTYADTYSLAGKITSANDYGYAQTERVIQLALRYDF
jgi:hypothetical protein